KLGAIVNVNPNVTDPTWLQGGAGTGIIRSHTRRNAPPLGSSRLLVSPSHPAAIPRARPPNSYGEKSPLQSATLPGNRVNLRGVRGPPNRARARCGAEFFRKVRAGAPRRSQRSSAP